MKNAKNIYLCGFMGCGKSTVGKALAELLCMDFADMDKYIEKRAKQKISDIFQTCGESYFRKLETEAAKELSSKSGLIVATGGGAALSNENVAYFKSSGVIVLIDVPLGIIKKRLAGDKTRPLLQRPDKENALRSLYNARLSRYREVCDIAVENTDDKSAFLVAREIAKKLQECGFIHLN